MVRAPSLSRDRKWPRVTKCTQSQAPTTSYTYCSSPHCNDNRIMNATVRLKTILQMLKKIPHTHYTARHALLFQAWNKLVNSCWQRTSNLPDAPAAIREMFTSVIETYVSHEELALTFRPLLPWIFRRSKKFEIWLRLSTVGGRRCSAGFEATSEI